MKKTIAAALAALTLFALSGCAVTKASPLPEKDEPVPEIEIETAPPESTAAEISAAAEPSDSPDVPPDEPDEITEENLAVAELGDIFISLPMPEGWEWEEINDDNGGSFGICFWKSGDRSQYAEVKYWESFGVCGTGLTEEKVDFPSGSSAWIGYYDGGSDWSFVSFCDDHKGFAAINSGLCGEKALTALDMLGRAEIGFTD